MSTKSYVAPLGFRSPGDGPNVFIQTREGEDFRLKPLPLRLDLRNHSPDGFAWGYGGSGPAQLALAVLADATGDDELAGWLYQSFKWQRIAKLDQDMGWELTHDEVLSWVRENVSKAEHKRLEARQTADWREDATAEKECS